MPLNEYVKLARVDGPTTGSTAVAARLQDLLRGLMAQKQVKHAIVAVESVDRSFRWMGVAGDAHPDGTPLREDTPIFIASVTKLYIAATIMKLYERDLIGLDKPISTYLPQSLIGGIHRLGGVDYTDMITVRHLLGHSSGLPDYLEDRPEGGQSLIERLVKKDLSWTIEEAMQIVRDRLTPRFPPQPPDAKRQKISYSDTNYQLLIAIIEAVTGQPLHTVFSEMLYAPLGLKHTFHPGTSAGPAPEPATLWLEEQPLDIPLAMRSFGDLVSTADDMLRFMQALIRSEIFAQPTTLDLMMGSWRSFGFSLNLAPTSPTWPIEYGLGMMRFRIPHLFSPLRPIPAVIGHTGVSGSWLFYCPRLDVLLAGTVNQATAAALPFRFVPKLLRVLD
jgi:D-alanyl-D-alanine carboxypeptidase